MILTDKLDFSIKTQNEMRTKNINKKAQIMKIKLQIFSHQISGKSGFETAQHIDYHQGILKNTDYTSWEIIQPRTML